MRKWFNVLIIKKKPQNNTDYLPLPHQNLHGDAIAHQKMLLMELILDHAWETYSVSVGWKNVILLISQKKD